MNQPVPEWIARLVGADNAGAGEGTLARLQTSWSWAPWVTLLFVLIAAGFVLAAYLTERGSARGWVRVLLAGIRFSLIALAMWIIAEWVLSLERTGLPYAVVVIDDSASMGTVDRYQNEQLRSEWTGRLKQAGFDEPRRIDLAKALLLENNSRLLREIGEKYKLRVYFLSSAARNQTGTPAELREAIKDVEPFGESTRLGHGLRTILNDLRGAPPAAIVLFSDGITTNGETLVDVADYARRKSVPLFTVALGDERPTRDLIVDDLLVDEVVFVDDIVNFEVKLTGTGFEGQRVDVVLKDKESDSVLAKKTATIGSDGDSQRVRLPYRPTDVGKFEYEVAVESLPEEAHVTNNRESRLVSVRKEKIRVLLVQAYPNYEFRYLKHLLQRDANTVELSTVLQDADVEYAQIDQTALSIFPVRRDDLFAYDVIIFGDVNPSYLSASVMRNVADFVKEKGGGVVFLAGPLFNPLSYHDTPLAELLPIDLSTAIRPDLGQVITDGFVMKLTELGLGSPQMQLGDTATETEQIWEGLPALYWMLETPDLKFGARVLAEHPSRLGSDGRPLPIISMQYVGSGKAIFHATDDTWRWRWRVGDVFFARYWMQTVRYLARSKLLGKDRSAELTVDRREYKQGETVRLRVRFVDDRVAPPQDDGVTVVVEREGEKNRRVTLRRHVSQRGIFEGLLSKPLEGNYHAWIAAPTLEGRAPSAEFRVVAPPGETARLQTETAELSRAAKLTKGRFYNLATVDQLLNDLPPGRQVPIETLPPHPWWNRWPVLMVFLCLIVTEWLLRKRQGML